MKLAVIIVASVITLAALYMLLMFKFDTSADAFFDKKDKSYSDFQEWKEQFGSGDAIAVSFSVPNVFTARRLALFKDITKQLEQVVPNVKKVTSITNANDIPDPDASLLVNPLFKEIPTTPKELEALRERIRANPSLKNIISANSYGYTVTFIIEFEQPADGRESYKEETFEAIKQVFNENVPRNMKYHFSGPAAVEHFYGTRIHKDFRKFLSILFVVSIPALVLGLRKKTKTLPPILAGTLSFLWALGLMCLCGYAINSVTVLLPLAIFSVGLIGPSLPASSALAAGFCSLLATSVPAVRQLGLVSAVSVFFAYGITRYILPKYPAGEPGQLKKLAALDDKFKFFILAGAVLLASLGLWGATKVKAETPLSTGSGLLNVSLRSHKVNYFKDTSALQRIQKLQVFLSSLWEVDKTTSAADYLKALNKFAHDEDAAHYRLPESPELINQYLKLRGETELRTYMSPEWNWTTVRVKLKNSSTAKLSKALYQIERYLEANLNDKLIHGEVLGQTALELKLYDRTAPEQLTSFALALLLLFSLFLFRFRSFVMSLIYTLSAAFPVLLNFGIMGCTGIRLDSVTLMAANIGCGIIAAELLNQGKCAITPLILILGLGLASSSRFLPLHNFGVLCSLLGVGGLFSVLMLHPVLLMLFAPKNDTIRACA
ncbi:MAG TPA: hypothetical protein VMD52_01365 [Patescibacteria group bacterium]|nr:hypothetical protein [Patescibacteria group bacterium]